MPNLRTDSLASLGDPQRFTRIPFSFVGSSSEEFARIAIFLGMQILCLRQPRDIILFLNAGFNFVGRLTPYVEASKKDTRCGTGGLVPLI